MAIKSYKPTTPGRRGMTSQDAAVITSKKPVKSLLEAKSSRAGRSRGHITVRHRGGGAKRHYRLVNFKNLKPGVVEIKTIEYDPNRSARIACIEDVDGKPHYILAAANMKVGQKIQVGAKVEIKPGNRLLLKHIPAGTSIYNIELVAGKGGQLARSAGTQARLSSKDKGYAHVKLPSGEVRLVSLNCYATIGSVGNVGHQHIKRGSAGRRRRMGWRPSVRGKAMNPADHPMGGGEGISGPGRLPRTPWGKMAIGLKTRRRKATSKYIVRHRKQGQR